MLELVDDKTHAFGMTLLTDNGPMLKEYETEFGCKLYTFPLKRLRPE